MASFREHVTVSSMLGMGYGTIAHVIYGFTPIESTLAGFLTGFGGMLPDLDSKTSRPVRELFGILGAVAPLLILADVQRSLGLPGTREATALTFLALYFLIRFGGSWLIGNVATHRGMFHSLPAVLIAGQIVFLTHSDSPVATKWLIAVGTMLGFLSHLVMDEIYSVEVSGVRVRLKKSSGTAMKMFSENPGANFLTYGILVTLCYAVSENIITDLQNKPVAKTPPVKLEQTAEFPEEFPHSYIR